MELTDVFIEFCYSREYNITKLRQVNKDFRNEVDSFVRDIVSFKVLDYFESIRMNLLLSEKTFFLYCLKYAQFAESVIMYHPPNYKSTGNGCIRCNYYNSIGKQCRRSINYKKYWSDKCWQHIAAHL